MNQEQETELFRLIAKSYLLKNYYADINSFIEQEVEKPAKLEGFDAVTAGENGILLYPSKQDYENHLNQAT